jgi:hypothetical protein
MKKTSNPNNVNKYWENLDKYNPSNVHLVAFRSLLIISLSGYISESDFNLAIENANDAMKKCFEELRN